MKRGRNRLVWVLFVLLLVALFSWGCSSSSSSDPAPELTLTEQVRAGDVCPAGGFREIRGEDIDEDGRLSPDEIESVEIICYDYEETDVISTAKGPLVGLETHDKQLFLGIPFAQPPVGDLRWKAPQELEEWNDTLEATQRADVCVQGEMAETWHASGAFIGNEDCLYLDVYRPNTGETDLPVYVFLHGGANRFGGGASYDGSYLAEDQNIIVVVPQYRLGPLGWLSHPALRTDDPDDELHDSGNFGLLDNIKALEWVRDNIGAFGGDPDRVTLGGQSAGASNVAKALISPLGDGLFQGAVLQSLGGAVIPQDEGDLTAEAMLDALEYDPNEDGDIASFLYSQQAEALINAHATSYAGFSDGAVLPGGYVESIYNGDYIHVPVLLGSTEYEWKNFMPLYAPLYGQPLWGNVYDLFNPDFDPDKDWRFDEIFPDDSDIILYEAIGKYRSLAWKSKSVDELATLLKSRGTDVFAYQFEWGGPDAASEEFAHIFGAAHSMDIPFFFGYDRDLFGYALSEQNRDGFEALQGIMMEYLGNFIRQQDPEYAGGVLWEQWSNDPEPDEPKYMALDADRTTARIGMVSQKVMPVELPDIVREETTGWPEEMVNLLLAQVSAYPAEYYLNDENHELLFANLEFEALNDAEAHYGVHEQAGYRIELPEGWEPGDDLVMYAHGFRGDTRNLTVSNPERLRHLLIDDGFAWAASSYTANGYNIVSGVQSTKDLLDHFKEEFGEPGRIYITGHSMGGHITARTVTDPEFAGDYDGALPMCGVVGGGNELFSYFLDWGLLASYFADLNYEVPYTEGEMATFLDTVFGDDRDGNGELGFLPPTAGMDAVLTPDGEDFRTATMYRSGGNRPLYDRAFSRWVTFAVRDQAASWLLDPAAGMPINVVGNESTVYRMNDDFDGLSEDEETLNNEIERVDDPNPDFFEDLMYPVNGRINIPVLTLHTLGDLFVPFSMPQIWAERISDQGNGNLFVARAIRSGGHCTFTVEEEITAFEDLVDWVENQNPPEGDDILDPDTVSQVDFGCRFTTAVNPAFGDDPLRSRDDPDYDDVCNP